MKTTLTRESATTVRVTVEATEEDLGPATDRAFRKLAQEIKVPGFRKGKVPPKVLEARLGRAAVREVALREAIPELSAEALVQSNLQPIAPPRVEVTSPEETPGVAFDMTVEVRPEIRVPDYGGIVVNRPSSKVTDDEVEDQLRRLQERFATLETVPRPAVIGDFALMNLRTYVHDRTIDRATGSDILYELGSEGFVPELDPNLEGKRAGDVVQFNTTLPETFGDEFAGQEVTCQILVKEVRVKRLPAIDDEFARTASEFDTLDELRGDLRSKLALIKKAAADSEVRNRVLETLVDSADFELPGSLVEEESAYRTQRLSDQIRGAGLTLDDYLAQAEQSEEQIETELHAQAERNVRAQLLLEEIGKVEELSATAEEIEDEIRRHAQALRVDPAELRKRLDSRERLAALAGDIIRRKVLDLVVGKAEIKYEDADEEAPRERPAPEESETGAGSE